MRSKHDVWARIANHRVFGQLFRVPRELWKERRGNVAILVGLSMPAIVGAGGITLDVANWYHAKKEAQVAADAAAYAAALNLGEQGLGGVATKPPMEVRANDAAGRNGYSGTVVLNYPPSSGVAVGNTNAVEAILTEPAPLTFAGIFWNGAPNIQARAVGIAVVADACMWALNPTEQASFSAVGTAQVNLNCGVVVNSNHPSAALENTGSSCVNATSVAVSGGATLRCVNPAPEQYLASYGDPMSGTPFVTSSDACINTGALNIEGGITVDMVPGRYCGRVRLAGGATANFLPGAYHFEDDLIIESTGFAFGTDVQFYQSSGSIRIAGGATVSLSAPSSPPSPYADNVLIYQAPSNCGEVNELEGGTSMDLEGIIYTPCNTIDFAGGSTINPSRIAVVSDKLSFRGTTEINGTYASSLLPERAFARLAE